MMRTLWTDKYRPPTVDGYVWKNETQKKQVEAWINEKAIPHLLFSGHPGTGKCLGGKEKVKVKINLDLLNDEQKQKLYAMLKNQDNR